MKIQSKLLFPMKTKIPCHALVRPNRRLRKTRLHPNGRCRHLPIFKKQIGDSNLSGIEAQPWRHDKPLKRCRKVTRYFGSQEGCFWSPPCVSPADLWSELVR